jgi:hypothetical protein
MCACVHAYMHACVCACVLACVCMCACPYVCMCARVIVFVERTIYFCKLQTRSRTIRAFEIWWEMTRKQMLQDQRNIRETSANLRSCLRNQKLANVTFYACIHACMYVYMYVRK